MSVVVSDLHLTRGTPPALARDFARLLALHRGERLIIAGDLFDRSAEASPPSIDELLERHSAVRRALSEHLEAGCEVVIVAGNHDAELGTRGASRELAETLSLSTSARGRLSIAPWFYREGDVHVEHGHLYDPDNAPAHPLVRGADPLGVRFVKSFIAPTGAYAFLNRNDRLPSELFAEAVTRYGARAPHVILTYFTAALRALYASGSRHPSAKERAEGDALLDAFAEGSGVAAASLRALCTRAPRATLESSWDTFARLYLDRVLGATAVLASLGLAARGHRQAAAGVGALGAATLAVSLLVARDRYGGRVVDALVAGAKLVSDLTGARTVIFGHAHTPSERSGYTNPGSFAFPAGERRVFARVAGGRASLEAMPPRAAPITPR